VDGDQASAELVEERRELPSRNELVHRSAADAERGANVRQRKNRPAGGAQEPRARLEGTSAQGGA